MSPTNRADQIRFLTGLKDGSRSLRELGGKDFLVAFQPHDNPTMFECEGELLTKAQLDEKFAKEVHDSNKPLIIFREAVRDYGNPKR